LRYAIERLDPDLRQRLLAGNFSLPDPCSARNPDC